MRRSTTPLWLAGALAGALVGSCYSKPATEGLACEEDAACGSGEHCGREDKCRVSCGSDVDCNSLSGEYCWNDPLSPYGGACLPCSTDCGGNNCCGEGWTCVADGCCPPGLPYSCGDGTCAVTYDLCGSGGGDDGGDDGSPGDDGGGDGTPDGGDPDYPRQPCSDAHAEFANFCAPPCSGTSCPSGATGSAQGSCVFNPSSSAADCVTDADCPNPGESCLDNAGGTKSCLAPASHCVLFCDPAAQNCPVEMICEDTGGGDGYCNYPP